MVAASETTLQELLEGSKQYLVPLYQRTYSWKRSQLDRLFDDVQMIADERTTAPAASHFIGSLVLAAALNNGPVGVQQYLVIDGQQRLTTLSVLLCAIRDYQKAAGHPERFEEVTNQFLINPYRPHHRLKLIPTQADRTSYLACVEATAGAGGSDLLGEAYRHFRARLSSADDPDDPDDIDQIQAAVLGGLAIVSVTAQPGDNAHRIFESLNNTGLRLTQGDLIRNELFMRLPTRGDVVYSSLWLPLQQLLSVRDLEQLFWLDQARTNARVKQTETYAEYRRRLEGLHDESDVESEVRRMLGIGRLFHVILNPANELDPDVRLRLQRLRDWDTSTVNPLLLHLLEQREQERASSAQIAAAMLYVESFLVRRMLIGQSTQNLNRILTATVSELDRALPVDEAVADYLSTGRKHFATDDEIKAAVKAVPFYYNGKPAQRAQFLRWLEASYESHEPADLSEATIEHVLPQTPTEAWLADFAQGLGPDDDIDQAYRAVLHTLGNLTLSGYNTALSNRPFAEKKEMLASSGVRMNQEIARESRWGRPQIHARSDRLSQRICSIWPAPTKPAEPVVGSNWPLMNRALAEMPDGSWTSYGHLAALIGSHPVAVGARLASTPVPNGHRVLQAEGRVSPGFAWLETDRHDDPRAVLEQEGVVFAGDRADAGQLLTADELAQLVGLDADDIPTQLPDLPEHERGDWRDRFIQQLTESQSPPTARAVLDVLTRWDQLGGVLDYGRNRETSCFPIVRWPSRQDGLPTSIWPVAVYPVSGACEVVFQHLAGRPPFDQIALRNELRVRLNGIAGIAIAESKLSLRPSFSLDLLTANGAVDRMSAVLAWFYQVVSDHTHLDVGPE